MPLLKEVARLKLKGRKRVRLTRAQVRIKGHVARIHLGDEVLFLRYDPVQGVSLSQHDALLSVKDIFNEISDTSVFW